MQYRHSILTLALLGMALCVGSVHAQDRQEISGTVTSADDSAPLPGANVSVPGSAVGTATNAEGQYSLRVPTDADSLRFSFVGFRAQTVAIAGRTTIDVALAPAAQQIDELVVVGYGSQEERDVTGAVNKVSSGDFNAGNVASPEQLIAGKISGVQISANSGAPGASSFIRIRGATSVNADNEPLFVVDGVPIENADNQASRNPLNFLNPGDIESVNVLKDASAAAIYGSRGANGVILIETSSASEGDARISYQGSLSGSQISDRIDVLDPSQFREAVQEQAPSQVGRLGNAETDWQDAVQRTGVSQEHSLSFSRGYEDSNIRLSLNYLDQQGTLETSNLERVSGSIKYNQDFLDDQLTIRTNLRGTKTRNQFEPGVVGAAASFAPTQPIRDVDSPFGGFFEWDQSLAENNPVASYVLTDNTGETYRSLGNVEAEYRLPFVDGLSARLNLGYDIQDGEREFFAPTFLKGQADQGGEQAGQVERRNFTRLNQLLDAYLSYEREFESIESEINATAGYSYQDFQAEFPEFVAQGLGSNSLGPNSTTPVQDRQFTNTFVREIPNRLISGFGRLNYTFKDRYVATLTVRRDGSSRFGPENRWGTFPSAALAWRAHQEPFLQDTDVLSNLKVRASWGVNGNQEIGNFLYTPLFQRGTSQVQAQFGDEFVSTVRPDAADETLQWEESISTNIGVDYGFLDGRISGSLEYYRTETEDLIFPAVVPRGANLSDVVTTNIGSMRNEGVEFSIDANVLQIGDFSYDAQLNASTNDNEVLEITQAGDDILTGNIGGGTGNTVQIIREGESLNSFFVYEHREDENGDPRSDAEFDREEMYVDQNGDGEINISDRVVKGSPQPDYILGHTSQIRFQNLDFSVSLRAHIGNDVYNNGASNLGYYNRLTDFVPSNLEASVLDTEFNSRQQFSDVYVEDASFLRLDNLSLGYTLESVPRTDRIRVYGTAQNLFVLTGYSGPDPEVPNGIDDSLYPRSRTYTVGVNVQL